ncbi:hypothetical protein I3F58_15425 [Streptomyces sp. MUM 203J]|uniref:hypothetical protein n=1 Tax=Streptomyces sp. MUM 203J TaxID=2791990 RepID=UPI001F043752|nr:hypothetical protein [Streptomyces sp. MUM 203J]MCH0540935.1 hypothetical protein [Streptomyces sp. MUM 203J]
MSEGRWGLIVEEADGSGERKVCSANVLEHVIGTREEAFARLEKIARHYTPQHPMSPNSTRLYRTAEGFLQVNEGSMRSYGCRFSVAELLYSSVEEQHAATAAREAERQAKAERKAAEKAAGRSARRRWFGR